MLSLAVHSHVFTYSAISGVGSNGTSFEKGKLSRIIVERVGESLSIAIKKFGSVTHRVDLCFITFNLLALPIAGKGAASMIYHARGGGGILKSLRRDECALDYFGGRHERVLRCLSFVSCCNQPSSAE